jgi:hypothetical protein
MDIITSPRREDEIIFINGGATARHGPQVVVAVNTKGDKV